MRSFIWLLAMITGLRFNAYAWKTDSVFHNCGAGFPASKKVSIWGTNVDLEEAVKLCLKNRSPYLTPAAFSIQKRVNIYVKDVSVPEMMYIIEEIYQVYFFVDKNRGGLIAVDRKTPFTAIGIVRGPRNRPLAGVNIALKGTNRGVNTNQHGRYSILLTTHDTIGVTYADMIPQEIIVDSPNVPVIHLQPNKPLDEVVVIDDGYGAFKQKYLTGAYEIPVMTRTRIHPSMNYLQRYDGLISRFGITEDPLWGAGLLSLRGRNSFNANTMVPATIDQFLVQVNSSFFNPDDMQQTILLKDAAAAVIYGSKGGNGAIVSTTFQVPYRDTFGVSVTTQWTLTAKPQTGYQRGIAASDYLDLEDTIFRHQAGPAPFTLSPAQDIYYKRDFGGLAKDEANLMINALRNNDLSREINRQFNRYGFLTHHSVSTFAAGQKAKGYASVSWDDHQLPEKRQESDRKTLMLKGAFRKHHLEGEAGIYHAIIHTAQNAYELPVQLPYLTLGDSRQNAKDIPYQIAPGALAAYGPPYLDWKYYPLQEAALKNNTLTQRLTQWNVRAGYSMFDSTLIAEALWQSARSVYDNREEHALASYFSRDLINRYNQGKEGPVPLGSILDRFTATTVINNLRGQIRFTRRMGRLFYISAFTGAEKRLNTTTFAVDRTYGNDIRYPEEQINYNITYPVIGSITQLKIPHPDGIRDSIDNYMSYYFNSNVTVDGRFNVSFGFRKDMTNHLSQQSNQHSAPLWALGISWDKKVVKLRATYGQTGNMDYGVAPFPTLSMQGSNNAGPVASLNPVPANNLTYERLSVLNGGVDLFLCKRWLTMSVDGYYKECRNLITIGPGNPTAGNAWLITNAGSLKGWGTEITLRTHSRKWPGRFLADLEVVYSFARQQVLSVPQQPQTAWDHMLAANYQPGKPVDAIYAFRYGGLRHEDGAPLGYLGDSLCTRYDRILDDKGQGSIQYMGTATPRHYASMIPAVTWGAFSLRCMLVLKAGYVFRQRSLHYTAIYRQQDKGTAAYDRRWQKPGDEHFTDIPSVNLGLNSKRDDFYQYSTANISKGDHLRIQCVQAGYEWIPLPGKRYFFKRWSVDLAVYNLGILWRANKQHLDPDAGTYGLPVPLSATLTVNARF